MSGFIGPIVTSLKRNAITQSHSLDENKNVSQHLFFYRPTFVSRPNFYFRDDEK